MAPEPHAYIGIDVGTGSVRAGLFDDRGGRLGLGTHPIETRRPAHDHVEQSSEDIWRAAGAAVRAALLESGLAPERVRGVGFDATCSLVALDEADRPVSVSTTKDDAWNVVVWMDHRAIEETGRINRTGHDVLDYVGGTISPEMQTPKLLWLKEQLPDAWRRSARFLDLPDYLTYRATGVDVRSLCSVTCKWTYLAHRAGDGVDGAMRGWQDDYFREVGLGDLVDEGYRRIGTRVRPMGERIGGLTAKAAAELGLAEGTAVGVSIIDAHAGGLGLLGMPLDGQAPVATALDERLALIAGTSSCHMAVSAEARHPSGIWGPYHSAMVPGTWLLEGGQSATGALIDHVIDSHVRGPELRAEAAAGGRAAQDLLNDRLDALSGGDTPPAELTRDLHVLPYFHGNRSPRADPSLRGTIAGLKLDDGLDALALLYLSTIQAIAHGTRHIVDTLNASGFHIDTLLACGGDTRNRVFLREHADATGCRIVLPRESEAVLLGAALLGAVASGRHPSILEAMAEMSGVGEALAPGADSVRAYHDRKHRIFHRMYEDQQAYRALMSGEG